jgi:putative PIG3 family NAD(P)H quinone oxidoreductase
LSTVRAVIITAPGGPEVLELRDVPEPEPGPGQVRVRVYASGLNRADLLQRRGRYPAPPGWPADVPGLEYAGVVDAVGPDARLWKPGDRVMGLVGGGGCAEAVVVHEREAIAVPEPLSLDEAAGIPEAFITAHDALFTRLGLALGETVLVHAVGSGVGTAALQLAKAAGARVIGTSRSAWKLERATSLGLDLGVDPAREDFADAALAFTGGAGVDAVLDLVGGAYLECNLRALASRGRLAFVGTVAGSRAELDMRIVMTKRLSIVGTTLRARPLEEKIAATRAFAHHALPLLEQRRIRPVLDRVLPADEVQEAHRLLEEGKVFGKVVLRWAEERREAA